MRKVKYFLILFVLLSANLHSAPRQTRGEKDETPAAKEGKYGYFTGFREIDWSSLPRPEQYPLTGGVYLYSGYQRAEGGDTDKYPVMSGYGSKIRYHDIYLVLDQRGLDSVKQHIKRNAIRLDARLLRDQQVVTEIHANRDNKVSDEQLSFKEARVGDIVECYQELLFSPLLVYTNEYFISREHPVLKAEVSFDSYDPNISPALIRLYHSPKDFTYDQQARRALLNLENVSPVPDERFSPPREKDAIWMQFSSPLAKVEDREHPVADYLGVSDKYVGTAKSWDLFPPNTGINDQNTMPSKFNANPGRVSSKIPQEKDLNNMLKEYYEAAMKMSLDQEVTSRVDLGSFIDMIKSLNLKHEIALVISMQNGELDKSWPTSYQFDRRLIVVNLEGKEIWMDPGFVGCPFGQLPWFDYEAGYLLPNYKGGFAPDAANVGPLNILSLKPHLETSSECKNCPRNLPASPLEMNKIKREIEVELSDSIRLNIEYTFVNWWAMLTRNKVFEARIKKIEPERVILGLWSPGEFYKEAKVLKIEFQGLDEFTDPLVVRLQMEMPRSSGVNIPPAASVPDWFNFKEQTRIRDIFYPVKTEENYLLRYKGIGKADLKNTTPADIKTDFASFQGQVQQGEGSLTVSAKLTQTARSIPVSEYKSVKQFNEQMMNWFKASGN